MAKRPPTKGLRAGRPRRSLFRMKAGALAVATAVTRSPPPRETRSLPPGNVRRSIWSTGPGIDVGGSCRTTPGAVAEKI